MNDTPRTDALWKAWADDRTPDGKFRYGPHDLAEFARQLERELAAERALADRLAETFADVMEEFKDWDSILWTDEDYAVLAAWREARNDT